MTVLFPVLILNMAAAAIKNKIKADGMMTYFILLMLSMNILYFSALVDLLKPAAVLLYAGFAVIILAHLFKKKKEISTGPDVYLILHNISCVVFALIFSIKKPVLYYWDELNIWGPSAKAVKLFDRLYSIGVNPVSNDRNYPAGNALLNYFFSFFDAEYKEYVLLLSYAFLFLACFALMASAVYKATHNHTIATGTYFLLLLSPFVAGNHKPAADFSSISYAYGTTMVDFNLAVVFAAAIALYLGYRNSKWHLLPLMFLVTIKKNGIFFALLAFCVICCFELFTFRAKNWKLKKAAVNVILTLLVPLFAYGAWFVHLDAFAIPQQPRIYSLKEETGAEIQPASYREFSIKPMSVKQAAPAEPTIKSIFIPSLRTERYNEILDEMSWYFMNNEEIVCIKDIYLIVGLFILGVAAALARKKGDKFATLLTASGLTAGCYVYNLVIGYQMQFYNDMMVEYPRYMLSYYFGWVYVVVVVFVMAPGIKETLKNLFVTATLVFMILNIYGTGLDYTVIDRPQNPSVWRREVSEKTADINRILTEDDRVYLVYKDQDAATYIRYRYNMLPAWVSVDTKSTGIDFSINFREKIDYSSDRQYYNVASPEKFADIMKDYFDYIYVVEPDEEFYSSYSHLFSDGMTNGTLYSVTDGTVPMQAVAV